MSIIEVNTKIEPLINALKKEIRKDYYLSDRFKIDCIQEGIDQLWSGYLKLVENNSAHTYIPGVNFKRQFVDDALALLINDLYEKYGANKLLDFISFVLGSYTSNEGKSVNTKDLKRGFAVIGVSEEELTVLDKYNDSPLVMDIPECLSSLNNADRLELLKKEIEESFAKGNYRDVNTRSYTFLEGVFKGFLQKNSVVYDKHANITQLASCIKDYLKENIQLYSEYCLQEKAVISLISTITHVVNDLRNRNSDSHFDGDSDMATSCFVKDLTYSVTNLLLNIKKNM